MTEADAEQAVAVALATVLDTAAAVVVLTGHASGNIVPADDAGAPPTRGLAYDVGPTTAHESVGEHYDVAFTVFAEAETRAACRGLLAAADAALTPAAFAGVGADAVVTTREHKGVVRGQSAHDPDPDRPREVFAGALEGTIWYTPA